MKYRSLKKHIKAQKVNMGGIILDQAIPVKGVDKIDPFLLIHHWSDQLKPGKKQQDVGVGPHPHRGFSPVTFIFKGGVHHRDSIGQDEVVYAGGTQWMNSGKGIVHSERPPKELAKNGGDFEIIQFWVNSPASYKMKDPSYQPITAERTPKVKIENGEIGVVAGNFEGKIGPAIADSELLLLRFDLDTGAKKEITIPEDYNALLYILDGNITVNDAITSHDKEMLYFEQNGEGIKIETYENTRAILLAGKPINESVATYGPFVMNTSAELMKAINDYNNGLMGVLNEKFD